MVRRTIWIFLIADFGMRIADFNFKTRVLNLMMRVWLTLLLIRNPTSAFRNRLICFPVTEVEFS